MKNKEKQTGNLHTSWLFVCATFSSEFSTSCVNFTRSSFHVPFMSMACVDRLHLCSQIEVPNYTSGLMSCVGVNILQGAFTQGTVLQLFLLNFSCSHGWKFFPRDLLAIVLLCYGPILLQIPKCNSVWIKACYVHTEKYVQAYSHYLLRIFSMLHGNRRHISLDYIPCQFNPILPLYFSFCKIQFSCRLSISFL
jgi:hypothetical protein